MFSQCLWEFCPGSPAPPSVLRLWRLTRPELLTVDAGPGWTRVRPQRTPAALRTSAPLLEALRLNSFTHVWVRACGRWAAEHRGQRDNGKL